MGKLMRSKAVFVLAIVMIASLMSQPAMAYQFIKPSQYVSGWFGPDTSKWEGNWANLNILPLSENWKVPQYYAVTTWNNQPSRFGIYWDDYSNSKISTMYSNEGWAGTTWMSWRSDYPDGRWWLNQVTIKYNTRITEPSYGDWMPWPWNMDGESVAAHEFGHVGGLDHSGYFWATMYSTIPTGSLYARDLYSDDLNGTLALYGHD